MPPRRRRREAQNEAPPGSGEQRRRGIRTVGARKDTRRARSAQSELVAIERELARVQESPDLGPVLRQAAAETLERKRASIVEAAGEQP